MFNIYFPHTVENILWTRRLYATLKRTKCMFHQRRASDQPGRDDDWSGLVWFLETIGLDL